MALRLQMAVDRRFRRSCFQSAHPPAGCRKLLYGRAPSGTATQLAMLSWHLQPSCLRWGARQPEHRSEQSVHVAYQYGGNRSAATVCNYTVSPQRADMSQRNFKGQLGCLCQHPRTVDAASGC